MKTLTATGEHGADAPTLTVYQRAGADGRPEVHIIARAGDGDTTKSVSASFDREALVGAIGPTPTARIAKEGA